MRERSVSRRNITGGFLGGIAGMLALGYIHPIGLPVGCFLGAVVGWWHQEIRQSVLDSFKSGGAVGEFLMVITIPCLALAEVLIIALMILLILVEGVLKAFNSLDAAVFRALVRLVRAPRRFGRWLRGDPMNEANTVRVLTIIAHAGLNLIWIVPAFHYISNAADTFRAFHGRGSFGILFIQILLTVTPGILVAGVYSVWTDNRSSDPESKAKWRSRNLEWYRRRGVLGYFGTVLVDFTWLELRLAFGLGSILVLYLGVGLSLLLVLTVPVIMAAVVVKAIFQFSVKSGHWLCGTVTLAVTTLVALKMRPYLGNTSMLWAAALFAGMASAAMTEAVRRLTEVIFGWAERVRALATNELGASLGPSLQAVKRVVDPPGNWLWEFVQQTS